MYGKKTQKTSHWSDRCTYNRLFAAGRSRHKTTLLDSTGRTGIRQTNKGNYTYRSSRPGYLALYSSTRNILYLKHACFGLRLKERGILHLKPACFALRLIEQGILHLKRAKWLENRGLSNWGEMTGCRSGWLPLIVLSYSASLVLRMAVLYHMND